MNLYFSSPTFTVIDGQGEVANAYPLSDYAHYPKETPIGAKCSNAKVAYGLTNKSSQITIQVEQYTQNANGDSQKEKVIYVVPVE